MDEGQPGDRSSVDPGTGHIGQCRGQNEVDAAAFHLPAEAAQATRGQLARSGDRDRVSRDGIRRLKDVSERADDRYAVEVLRHWGDQGVGDAGADDLITGVPVPSKLVHELEHMRRVADDKNPTGPTSVAGASTMQRLAGQITG